MIELIWSPRSLTDLEEIRAYIAADSPAYADLTVRRLVASVERLRIFPEFGRMVPERQSPALREVISGKFVISANNRQCFPAILVSRDKRQSVEPIGILVTAALFVGAEVVRKPTDEFAGFVWGRVKQALLKTFDRDPAPSDVTEPALTRALEQVPEIRADLESVYGRTSGLRRARLVQSAIRGAKILWVDDHSENNAWERQLLSVFGVQFVTVESTRAALASLGGEAFDLVVSDIARADNPREGVDAIRAIRSIASRTPIVFYVGDVASPIPPLGAQGITDEPNELIHLLLDQLERHRL